MQITDPNLKTPLAPPVGLPIEENNPQTVADLTA